VVGSIPGSASKLPFFMLHHSSVTIIIPIKLANEANSNEHWTKKAKRHKMQKFLVTQFLKSEDMPPGPPWNIILTRIAPKVFDDDNLQMAFKWVRDAVSEYLLDEAKAGHADNDRRLTWKYKHEKGNIQEHKIKVEIISN
jgi:hypothetical protein